jgi:hypothetical protein
VIIISGFDDLNKMYSRAFKNQSTSTRKLTLEEQIALNKEKFNLTHGKGKRKKHKSKRK